MSKQILIIIASLFLLLPTNSQSQEKPVFNITGLETAEFPLVKSYIIAKNGRQNQDYYSAPLNLPNPPDFDLLENGVSKDESSLVLKCEEIEGLLPVHIALVVDASQSMFESWKGETRADVLERAVDEFIDSVKFVNGTSMHIVPFAGNETEARVWGDWNFTAEDAKEDFLLYDRLNGRTDFNTPMFEEPSGKHVLEIFKSKPAFDRKVVVFLTDGAHDNPNGNNPFEREKIIEDLQSRGIEFYSVTFDPDGFDSVNDLKDISQATGGIYTNVNTEQELRDYWRAITDDLKSSTVCWLEWESNLECNEVTERNVEVTFTRTTYEPIQRTFSYTPPEDKAIARVSRDNGTLFFDNSGAVSQDITLTAEVGDFKITGFNITNNDNDFEIPEFDNMPADGFVLDEGDSKTFAVNYIKDPSDAPKDFDLVFETDLCPVEPVDLVAPCGPTTNPIDFGNVNLSGGTDYVAIDVFTNNSTEEISGTVTLEGTDYTEFAIKSVNGNTGADFTLGAGESMDVELTITPTTPGTKTANLNYGITSDCGVATSSITANVIEADLALSPMNWDLVRVNNPVTMTYTITNTNDNDVEIEAITLSDNSQGFALGDVSGSLANLTANGGETSFDITFTPNAEGNINVDLIVKLANRNESLSARLSGIGFLPEIDGNDVTFTDVEVNTAATPVDYVVTNNSDFGVMEIKDIRLKAGSDNVFNLDLTNFTSGTTLSKGQTITIPVNFNPTSVGTSNGVIIVEADNIEGPEPVSFVLNEFDIVGTSIPGDGVTLPVTNFGPILSCELEPKSVTLENTTSQQIDVTSIINQTNINFELAETSFSIPANSSREVTINYVPSDIGTHTATAIFTFSDGFEVTAPLEGVAITEAADLIVFDSPVYSTDLGRDVNINFSIDFSSYDIRPNTNASQLVLTIGYNSTTHYMLTPSITSDLPITPVVDLSNQKDDNFITATFNGSIPVDKAINFEMPLLTTLGNDTMSVIDISAQLVDLNCLTINDASVESFLLGCNLSGSLINTSDNSNGFRINGKNPAEDVLQLEYELPFDSPITLDIYSAYGNIVKTVEVPNAKQGFNDIDLDISDLASGTYLVNYKSNAYQESIRFIKIK